MLGGYLFGAYSGYQFILTSEYFYAGAMIFGMFASFNQADRNVYLKRLENLHDRLFELDIELEVERVNYYDYEIEVNNNDN